jgi:hypothetical protein
MSSEVTLTAANDVTFAAWVSEQIIAAARPKQVVRPLFAHYDLSGKPTKAIVIPSWGALAATAPGEGTDLSNTAFTTNGTTVTCAEVGVMIKPTDMLIESDVFGDLQPYFQQLGLAIGDKEDLDCCALADGLTPTVGTSGADMAVADFVNAQYTLAAANAPGPWACVLHPIQVADLRNAAAASGAAAFGTESLSAGILQSAVTNPNGFRFNFMGTDVFEDSNIPADTTVDRNGMMFSVGVGGAFAHASKWEAKVETERDASMRATELVGSSCYGVAEIIEAYGVNILTDY